MCCVVNPQALLVHGEPLDLPGLGPDELALVLPETEAAWRVRLDPDSRLPRSVTVTETDPVLGPVQVTAAFDDWRETQGIATPFRVTKRVDGALVRRELRETVAYLPAGDEGDAFAAPEGLPAGDGDDDLFAWGWDMAHWFLRRAAMAAPADDDQSREVTFLEVGEGVFQVLGSSHHNLVIVGQDGLAVVDAPLYDRRSRAVLDALAARWPDKPVTDLVLTHHHNDHVGGLQPYVAAGARLVVPARSAPFFDGVVRRTLGVEPEILPVAEKATLPGFGPAVSLHAVPNSHANDMLVVHLPSQRLLFNSDLFSPGREAQHPLWAAELLFGIRHHGLDVAKIVGGHGHGAEPLAALEELVGG